MAESYAREILGSKHGPPYYVGGWSLGGVIGLEVARLLHELGKRVAVVLLDSHLPSVLENETQAVANAADLESYLASLAGLREVPAELARLPVEQRYSALWALIGAADEAEVGGLANVLALYARQVAAAQGFRARKVHFPVALFVARQAPRSLQQKQRARWRWLARGSWSERSVPGSHHTLLLAPNVQTNARAVADYLNALDGARGKGMHRNPLSGAARPHLPLSGRAGR